MKRTRHFRTAGWLAVAGLLGAALIAPSGALAETGNQTNVDYTDATQLCTGGPNGDIEVDPGQVAWVFVHAGVDKDLTGTLTAHFDVAGTETADSYVQGGIKYLIVTGPDTLLDFSDDIDGGTLTLSHVCVGETTTTTTSSSDTTSTSETTDTTSTVSSETSDTTSTSETTDTTSTVSSETSDTTTSSSQTTSVETSSSATGSVEGETGAADTTPPPTDALGSGSSNTSGDGWRFVLLGMAGLLGAMLLLTPAAATRKR